MEERIEKLERIVETQSSVNDYFYDWISSVERKVNELIDSNRVPGVHAEESDKAGRENKKA